MRDFNPRSSCTTRPMDLELIPKSRCRYENFPFSYYAWCGPFPNPKPCIEEEVQPDRTPVEWYDDASRDVELAIESAHTSLDGYQDRMKQTYDRRRRQPMLIMVIKSTCVSMPRQTASILDMMDLSLQCLSSLLLLRSM